MIPSGNVRLVAHSPDHLKARQKDPGVYETQFGIGVAEGVREMLGALRYRRVSLLACALRPWRAHGEMGLALFTAENRLIGLCNFNGPPDAEGSRGDFQCHRACVHGAGDMSRSPRGCWSRIPRRAVRRALSELTHCPKRTLRRGFSRSVASDIAEQ